MVRRPSCRAGRSASWSVTRRGLDRQRCTVAVREVAGRVEREGGRAAGHEPRPCAPDTAQIRAKAPSAASTGSLNVTETLAGRDATRVRARSRGQRPSVRDRRRDRSCACPGRRTCRWRSRPTGGGVERVGRCWCLQRHGRLALHRVVGGAGEAGAPLGARVDADLADRVDDAPPPLRRTIASSPFQLQHRPLVCVGAAARIARVRGGVRDRRRRRRLPRVPAERLLVSSARAAPLM